MEIVCAPNSFKETLTAMQAAKAMGAGVKRADDAAVGGCDLCPVGDGGEGTMDALIGALGGSVLDAAVSGPLGETVRARYGVLADGKTAVVELAQASGLALVPPDRRDPEHTSTFGAGMLVRMALERGCDTVIICIGGSATVDGATGIAQALGARFWDQNGRIIQQPMTGGKLVDVARFEPPPPHRLPRIRVACDVTNPLCGPEGAAAVYGPQKGATPEQVRRLDAGLARLASIVGGDPNRPGAGAAGGAGFGLAAMCGGQLERGIDLVLDAVGFERRCAGASLILTGEGRLDAQSLRGKACNEVARAAARLGVPTIAIVGSTGPGAEDCVDPAKGGMLRSYVSLADRFGLQDALRRPAMLIAAVSEEIARASTLRRSDH